MQWVIVAAMICGFGGFTSCSDDKDSVSDRLGEKIIGGWITADRNGKPLMTNEKAVYTFVADVKAYLSVSLNIDPDIPNVWMATAAADVVIRDNKMTLTSHPDKNTTVVEELTVTAINASEFTANQKVTFTYNGVTSNSDEGIIRFTSVTTDYNDPILGLWECQSITGGETNNDDNGRLEFLDNGSYRFYRMTTGGEWQAVTTREFQNYFVDGTLLATRWKDVGEQEMREWWEIVSISDDQMQWTALRQNDNGSTFQQGVTWKKVKISPAE